MTGFEQAKLRNKEMPKTIVHTMMTKDQEELEA